MMNLKNHKKNIPGFMLSEVLIALVVISILAVPVFSFISNSLRLSARFRNQNARLFAMKNFMLEKIYKSKDEKKQNISAGKKIKELRLDLKYERSVVKKQKPLGVLSKQARQNLCLQQVIATFDRQKEKLICFLYKPKL